MVKKLFALTSITALTGVLSAGVMGGCSSDSSPRTAGADGIAQPPAAVDPGATEPKADASKDDAEEPQSDEGCLTKDPIDATKYPYSEPTLAPGSCTQAESDKLTEFFDKAVSDNKDPSAAAWAAQVSERCSKCAFTPVDAKSWGPILVKDDAIQNVNTGGCIGIVSGKPACGTAFQQYSECQLHACLLACTEQDAYDACIKDTEGIQAGPCHEATQAVIDECGAKINDYQKGCTGKKWAFEGPLKVMCITGGGAAADGG